MAGSRDHRHDEFPIPDLSIPENRHEHRDVNVWAVYKFGIALAVLCVTAVALLYGMYKYLLNREGGPMAHDGTNVDARSLPPMPRLQPAPIADMKDMRAAEDKILKGYGWVDQGQGVTRIPVDRAIELLAQRGIPGRTTNLPARDVSIPRESGLGPKVHRPGGPLAGAEQPAAGEHGAAGEHKPAAQSAPAAGEHKPAGGHK
jgi:hypothetical protein